MLLYNIFISKTCLKQRRKQRQKTPSLTRAPVGREGAAPVATDGGRPPGGPPPPPPRPPPPPPAPPPPPP
ncbi:hypothetical protein, partial [Acinetobacter baumannii]|uniref:hypothetical protein n=1 Tax=Acinetobacter baumannii TaxID=470 RepID=UPI0038B58492